MCAARRWRAWTAVGLLACCGCTNDYSPLDGSGGASASASTGASTSSTGGAGGSGTAGNGGSSGDGGSGIECPQELRGPPMVAIAADPPYCIDATEVTNADYGEFLTANPFLTDQPAPCEWNDSGKPAELSYGDCMLPVDPGQAQFGAHPVVCVDWCDALAYCAWAGKRLCGGIRGGAASYDSVTEADGSQWYRACSGGGALAYPYGDTHEEGRCDDASHLPNGITEPVMAAADCVGGYLGLHDMAGSVIEWEDACDKQLDDTDHCLQRGGSYLSSAAQARCDHFWQVPRAYGYNDVGFRCCSL
jgi:formylglycine-generating enzyme